MSTGRNRQAATIAANENLSRPKIGGFWRTPGGKAIPLASPWRGRIRISTSAIGQRVEQVLIVAGDAAARAVAIAHEGENAGCHRAA